MRYLALGLSLTLWLNLSTPLLAAEGDTRSEGMRRVDELREAGRFEEAWGLLAAMKPSAGSDAGVLWRLARGQFDLGKAQPAAEKRTPFYRRAADFARAGIKADPENYHGYKWLSIALGSLAESSGARTQVELSRLVKINIEKAIALNPEDDLCYMVLGRWHLEVASVGFFTRVIARIVYGGLPGASLEEAEKNFLKAIRLRDRIVHRYYLARVYLEMGRRQEAKSQLVYAVAMPLSFPHEAEELRKSRELLEKLE